MGQTNRVKSPPIGKKVFVYRNLHRKCWSLKSLEGNDKGLVIAHLDEVVLDNPTPKISEAGRQRVLKEGRKNVHAGIVGYISSINIENNRELKESPYDPIKFPLFFERDTKNPTVFGDIALLKNGRIYTPA